MRNYLIWPWEQGQGIRLQWDWWLPWCWAVWEGCAGIPEWWPLLEKT